MVRGRPARSRTPSLAGADDVLLPMVVTVEQVDRTLDLVNGRCGVGILIETLPAVAAAAGLATRPLSRIYVGLSDLRTARGSSQLFEPLVDGTVDRVRADVEHVPFGVAGLTRLDAVQVATHRNADEVRTEREELVAALRAPSVHCSWREASTRHRAGWEW